ncbi:hypothetical protein [Aquipseudomonas alcaligenes]|uniref:Immunity protein 42 n=1 Tax=Aquipseudomonas alcaligenes TaxID=43263 RepID=A0A1N6XUV8_AQUAC|nr:hypothetical protein [Pseudomonas alcaligenes]SIR06064.1 hypothetical protein SAMN05878282_1171 [Pseudomonas alcaligenes]
MFFGKEREFAIEFENEGSTTLAKARVWIDGLPIGTLLEETYIPSLVNQLSRLLDQPLPSDEELSRLEKEGLEYIFSENCTDNGQYLVSLGDTFDDFVLARYKSNAGLVFLIQAVDNPFFTYSQFTPGAKYRSVIDADLVSSAILKFNSYLNG